MPNVPNITGPKGIAADDSVELIGYLRDRDVPCPLCGYNLRGLTSGRCPECGSGLRLSVGLAEPFLRAWITTVVALCSGAGIGMLFVVMLLKEGPPSGESQGFYIGMGYFLIAIPAAAITLLMRRNFLKLRKPAQICLSLSVVIATLIAFVTFFMSVH